MLETLYSTLPDRSKIYVGKTVMRLEPQRGGNRMQVHTRDDSPYDGGLFVRAAGSIVVYGRNVANNQHHATRRDPRE